MSTLAMTRLELRRLFVRPLAWVLGALTLAWLGWNFTLLLGSFLAAQIRLAQQRIRILQRHDGVHPGVESCDLRQVRMHDFAARHLPLADGFR